MSDTDFLYPKREHYDSGCLDVGDGHILYYEQSGNAHGIPIVCLHGGPGLSISRGMRSLFDPEKFRLVQYDQRGCGQSTPTGSLENNTTAHLVADLNKLRQHLNIDTWHVFGGSWGCTLALAYTHAFPEQVASLIVNGIFLGTQEELRSVYWKDGVVAKIFPDVFEQFYALIPEDFQDDPLSGYHALLSSKDAPLHSRALAAWIRFHSKISMLDVSDTLIERYLASPDAFLTEALFESCYLKHHCFIDGAALLRELPAMLRGKRVEIIQGRYDMVCPFETAWRLHKALKESRLHIVANAGHSSSETSLANCLVTVLNDMQSSET